MKDRHDSIPDTALVEAARRGDRDAAARLYHRHIDRVHRICYRIVLDRTQVADCVQEVWFKVFRSLGQFECEESFAAWLNCVAANTAIDCYRKWRRRGRHIDIDEVPVESLPAEEPDDGQELDDALTRQRIEKALKEITVNQRTAFVLRYLEGMTPAEIAAALGCREGTVRTHIRRCLVALRAKLAVESNQQGFGP
ncbi:MAG: sigma-70 family RNA polymerase sigma factor [Sedimentisphaerales bacterium]|nr:sigma-70 family RNA polymerase sigma factor [Sedimentisphaerales bacterium]